MQHRTCPGCGTTRDDWCDPETGRRYRHPKWIVEVDECPGCSAIESARSMAGEHEHQVGLRRATDEDFVDD